MEGYSVQIAVVAALIHQSPTSLSYHSEQAQDS